MAPHATYAAALPDLHILVPQVICRAMLDYDPLDGVLIAGVIACTRLIRVLFGATRYTGVSPAGLRLAPQP